MSAHDWRSVPSDLGSFDACVSCDTPRASIEALRPCPGRSRWERLGAALTALRALVRVLS